MRQAGPASLPGRPLLCRTGRSQLRYIRLNAGDEQFLTVYFGAS
jgi:hypothetical protein